MFKCSDCEEADDRKFHDHWDGHSGLKSFKVFAPKRGLFGGVPSVAKCPDCLRESATIACPHCHNELERDMVDSRCRIISVIGAKSSGKTNYITALVEQMKGQFYSVAGSFIDSKIGPLQRYYTDERYRKDFYKPLYENKQVHAPTVNSAMNNVPLIYRCIGYRGKKQVLNYLVFYDTAGENFHDPKMIDKHVRFLKNSDGFIFLLDTFGLPEVHKRLSTKYNMPPLMPFDTIYGGFTTKLKEYPGVKDKPFAFVFTKIDAVCKDPELFPDIDIAGMNSNSAFLHNEYFDRDDVENVHVGMASILTAMGHKQLLRNFEDYYTDYKLFGVSALGEMPDSNNKISEVEPFRVMDPIVWILDRLKFPIRTKPE